MKRILVTDDSPIMRRNLNAILTQAGYAVAAEAANGEEALAAYRRHRPDLVTMDITMPVMDGLEAVKRIVREDPGARILVISAFDQRSMLFEAMENGAKQYLIKPITADKLLAAVGRILGEAAEAPSGRSTGTGETSVSASVEYFRVDNRNGQFSVRLLDPMRPGPYPELQAAVQGLLFVKPLDLAFRFGDAERCRPELGSALESLIRAIRGAGGQVSVSARQEPLADALRGALSVPISAEGETE
ncbi:response regulator [Cohnella caldifontis]|uniref:response regulator n=1 Tax=Cohnella caldifontis TaxID=3027471 RepID=UPI0023EDF5B2|nr:response regulator [Cohnella sp. YIM B05605]